VASQRELGHPAVAQVDVTIPENAFGGQAMWVQAWIRALVDFFPKKWEDLRGKE